LSQGVRTWTCHWQWRYWRPEHNPPAQPIRAAGTNKFVERGVGKGDRLYIVSLSSGTLYLGGRMTVGNIVSREEGIRLLGSKSLYEEAGEWAIGEAKGGTPLHLRRALDPRITERIRFRSPQGEIRPPFFDTPSMLNVQATRGVREITNETASLFESILDATDTRCEPLVVTPELLGSRGHA